jgi:putative membrane protein
MFFVVYVFPGPAHVHAEYTPMTPIVAAIVLGIINAILRPILIILTLPVEILTLGLFTLIINAFTLWIVTLIGPIGLTIDGFFPWIFVSALILGIISFILSHIVKEVDKERATTP